MNSTLPFRLLFGLIFVPLVFVACDDDDTPTACESSDCTPAAPSANALKVLPIGDSRVEGFRPNFESYRYELYKDFLEENRDVDFIGTRTDPGCYPAIGATSSGTCFDTDHEGTGGFTTSDVLNLLAGTTFSQTPDVVTLGIGGNDLLQNVPPQQALNNLNAIIDDLQALNDSLIIFVEQIAPVRSNISTPAIEQAFNDYNAGIPAIATAQSTGGHQVIVVDMRPGWTDANMADDVHYNEAGARVVAERYYAAIRTAVY